MTRDRINPRRTLNLKTAKAIGVSVPTFDSASCRRGDRIAMFDAAVHESAIGTKRTSRDWVPMSAFGGKADIDWRCRNVRFWPKADIGGPSPLWRTRPFHDVL